MSDENNMYKELCRDQENTIILLCKHLRRCLTLLEVQYDMEKEERFLAKVEDERGIEFDSLEEGEE